MIIPRNSSAAPTIAVTVDDLDKSIVLSPLRDWGRSNQGQGAIGGSFSFSNSVNASAVFSFPQNATSFFWRGFLRPGPALYSICIDCANLTEAALVDGHACPNQSTDVITTLFSKTGLLNSGHTITITNLLDPRFGAASHITIDSFIIIEQRASSSGTSTSTTGSSQISQSFTTPFFPAGSNMSKTPWTTTAMSDNASPTTEAYWSKPSTTTGLSAGAIVGAVFGGAFALLGVVALCWWLLRKKHLYGKLSSIPFGERKFVSDAESPASSTLKLPPENEKPSKVQGAIRKPSSHRRSYKPAHIDVSRPPREPNPSSNLPPSQSRRKTSPVRPPPPPQWGIITVRLSSTFQEETHGTESNEVEFDIDLDTPTPYPSSEIGSSFITSEHNTTSDAGPLGVERVDVHNIETISVSNRAGLGSQQTGSAISQGWRRI